MIDLHFDLNRKSIFLIGLVIGWLIFQTSFSPRQANKKADLTFVDREPERKLA